MPHTKPPTHHYNCNTFFDTLHLRHLLIDKRERRGAGEGGSPSEERRAKVERGEGGLGLSRVDKLIY